MAGLRALLLARRVAGPAAGVLRPAWTRGAPAAARAATTAVGGAMAAPTSLAACAAGLAALVAGVGLAGVATAGGAASAEAAAPAPATPAAVTATYPGAGRAPEYPPPIPASAMTSTPEGYDVGAASSAGAGSPIFPGPGSKSSLTLYQYEVCPFCNKVRAFLDLHNIPYHVVEVNPLTKKELKWSAYRKVPVVVTASGEQINDSSVIVSRLQAELDARAGVGGRASGGEEKPASSWLRWWGGGKSTGSKGGAGRADGGGNAEVPCSPPLSSETAWRRWTDDYFVRLMTVNIYRTLSESWQTFAYIGRTGNFGLAQNVFARSTGAPLMYFVSGRMRSKYGVEGDVRERLYEAVADWLSGVEASGSEGPFHGGSDPDLADLSMFGVLRAIAGTDTFNDIMLQTRIGPWYTAVFERVGDSARVGDDDA